MSGEKMSGDRIRRSLAGGLSGLARGLSASARAFEQASWILRPREPAAAERPPAPDDVAEPAPPTRETEITEPGVMEPGEPEEPGEPRVMETLQPGIGEPSATDPRAEAGPAGPREPEGREPTPTEPEAAGSGPATPEAAARDAEAAVSGAGVTEVDPAAEPPPTVSAPEGPDHVRVAETHIAELGDRSVADILDEIPNLSTDELEQLYAYEVTHKDRKTVRRAIERAVQPTSGS